MSGFAVAGLTAVGVGGATVVGSGLGFLFKNLSHKFSDIVLSFAAGVMLAAAVFGLILPSVDSAVGLFGNWGILVTIGSIFLGRGNDIVSSREHLVVAVFNSAFFSTRHRVS